MKLELTTDPITRDRTYVVTISADDLANARLYDFDRKLLADCDGDDATIADRLLGLELLARRVIEGRG